MSSRRSHDLARLSDWILAATVSTVPTLCLFGSIYPTVLPKGIIGGLAVELAVLALISRLLYASTLRIWISWSLSLFGWILIATGLSIVLGIDRFRGIWGTAERMDGIFFQLGFWLIFGLLATRSIASNIAAWLARWFVLGSLATFVYAIAQQRGLGGAIPGVDSYSSTFGNPAFYGTYLTFVFWIAIYLLVVDPSRAWHLAYATIAGTSAVFLFLAHSRAPLLGWFLGLLLLLVLAVVFPGSARMRRWSLAGAAAAVLLAGAIFIFRDLPAVRSIPGISRLVQAGARDPTTRLRLVNARVALNGFRERPIFGWGLNGYTYIYQRHFDAGNLTNDPRLYDKAHNVYAEILSEQGIVGFLSYGIFVGYLIVLLWPGRSLSSRILLCGLATYLIQSAFLFDTPTTRMASMFLFGLIAQTDPRGRTVTLVSARVRWSVLLLIGTLLIAHMIVLVRTLQQSREASTVAYALPGRISDSLYVKRTMDEFLGQHSFMNREVLTELYRSSAGVNAASPGGLAFQRHLLAAMRDDFDKRPNDYRLGVDILKTASDLAMSDTFRLYLDPVTALAPRRPEALMLAGEMAFREGRVDDGRSHYLAAIQLNPALAFPYWALGRELQRAGRAREAKTLVEAALARGFDFRSAAALTTLIRVYDAVGDSASAARYVAIARVAAPSVMDSTITR